MKTFIKNLGPYQTLGLMALVMVLDGYGLFYWLGRLLREGGNEWNAIWFGIPIAVVIAFPFYKDALNREE